MKYTKQFHKRNAKHANMRTPDTRNRKSDFELDIKRQQNRYESGKDRRMEG